MKYSKLKTYLTEPVLIDETPEGKIYQLYFPESVVGTADTGYDVISLVSHIEVVGDEDGFYMLIQFDDRHWDPINIDMTSFDEDIDVPIKIFVNN